MDDVIHGAFSVCLRGPGDTSAPAKPLPPVITGRLFRGEMRRV